MIRFTLGAAFALTATIAVTSAHAEIVGHSTTVNVIDPPDSVDLNELESNDVVFAFHEQMAVELIEDLVVDATEPGTYGYPNGPTGSVIGAGVTVDTYMLHFDGVGDGVDEISDAIGQITFDQRVLGIVTGWETLDATDDVLGMNTTLYPTGEEVRGLEFNGFAPGDDIITLTDNADGTWTVEFDMGVRAAFADQMRIIVENNTVPAPGAMALLGLAALAGSRRRRRA